MKTDALSILDKLLIFGAIAYLAALVKFGPTLTDWLGL